MANGPSHQNDGESLAQAAIRCYLTTLLAATDCMVETCPDVGMTFKRRWARAPQRIGFEANAASLENSRREFENDLRAFAEYAGRYFRPGVPLVEKIALQGASLSEAVLEKVAAHSVQLETLSESLATIADMEAAPHLRETLEHQAAGLLHCARKAEQEMLPLLTELRTLIGHCNEVVAHSQRVYLVDVETGMLNRQGFGQELERRVADESLQCLLRLKVKATGPGGQPCSEAQFTEVLQTLAPAVFEQFRASEAIGLWDRQISVIFGGTVEQARRRRADIERRLNGEYNVHDTRIKVAIEMQVFGKEQKTDFMAPYTRAEEPATSLA